MTVRLQCDSSLSSRINVTDFPEPVTPATRVWVDSSTSTP